MTDEYLEAFARESEEHITELNNALLEFERDPTDEAAMEQMFRTAHTLKGNCGAMGFDAASDLAHAIEDLLESVRASRVEVTPELMDAVFDGVDELEGMIGEAVQHGAVQRDPTDVIETLRAHAAAPGLTAPTDDEVDAVLETVRMPRDSEHSVYHVRLEVAGDEAAHGRAIVDALEDAFDLLGTHPDVATIDAGDYDGSFDAVFATPVARSAVENALDPVDAVATHVVTDVTERVGWGAGGSSQTDAAPSGEEASADQVASSVAEEDYDDVSVDELLEDEDVDQFDDLEELAEEVEDTGEFDDLDDAGSFADMGIEAGDVAVGGDDGTAGGSDAAGSGSAGADDDGVSEADDDEVQDATAEFEQLKEEVDPVGFDELQEEIEELEFDEYDSDDEVGFDELLGEDDLDDESFGATESVASSGSEDAPATEATDSAVEELSAEAPTDGDDPSAASDDDPQSDAAEAMAEVTDDALDASSSDGDGAADPDAADADAESAVSAADDGPTPADDAADATVEGSEPAEAEPVEDSADVASSSAAGGDASTAADATASADDGDADDVDEAEPADPGGIEFAEDRAPEVSANDDGGEAAAQDSDEPGESSAEPDATAADLFGGGDVQGGSVPAAEADDDGAEDVPVGTEDDLSDDSFGDVEASDDAGSVETDHDEVESFGDESVLDLDGDASSAGDADAGDGAHATGSGATDDAIGLGDAADAEDSTDDGAIEAESFEFADADEGDLAVGDADDEDELDAGGVDVGGIGSSGPDDGPSLGASDDPDAESALDDPGFRDAGTSYGEPVVTDVDEERLDRIRTLGVPERQGGDGDGADASQSVRVQIEQLDTMLSLVEGLVTSRARLRRALEEGESRQVLEDELEDLEDVTSELQDSVMDVRLVPLRTAVTKLPRIVRDVAREQDKDVEFEMHGEDVELDRSILEEIGDPLVHLVRNAVDHGIERPDEREAADKPDTGSVDLRARRERDRVYVSVEDDGRGIDPDDLRDAAVEEGVYDREEVEAMDDDEALDLVFHAGLSTAEEVTDVSGRGVGMDVVAETVESLDGSVSIESEPGEGTTIELELPVTLAIEEVLFVEVGDEEFGVPVKAVDEVAPFAGADTEDGQEVLASDGGETDRELLRLSEALGVGTRTESGSGMLVHLREDLREATLLSDDVRGQQEVVVKPFAGVLEDVPGLAGATVLGDGDVVTILDVETV